MFKLVWVSVCLIAALGAGYLAFIDPQSFLSVSGIFASVLSVLVGVSLATIAVLSTPFQAAVGSNMTRDYETRLKKSIEVEEVRLSIGQLIIFYSVLFSLVLVILSNWVATPYLELPPTKLMRILSAGTAMPSVFSLLWSARLPYLLFAISKQRRELS
jgi:hypothetical protein